MIGGFGSVFISRSITCERPVSGKYRLVCCGFSDLSFIRNVFLGLTCNNKAKSASFPAQNTMAISFTIEQSRVMHLSMKSPWGGGGRGGGVRARGEDLSNFKIF